MNDECGSWGNDGARPGGMRGPRAYQTPSLKVYGSLTGLTLGTMGGGTPDMDGKGNSGSV
jgi:hypothetical protein